MKARINKDFIPESSKDCWHIYSLQDLTPAKFVQVVDKFLKGQCSLLTPRHGMLSTARRKIRE